MARYLKFSFIALLLTAYCIIGNAADEIIELSLSELTSSRVPDALAPAQQSQINHPSGWSIYPNLSTRHFPINVTVDNDDSLTISSNEPFILTLDKLFTLLPQQRYEISCMAAGIGEFGLGFYYYKEGKHDYLLKVVHLKDDHFQPVKFELDKGELSLAGIAPRFHAKGEIRIKELQLKVADDLPTVSLVEGTVVRASKFPDPSQSDYADCLYTVEFELDSIAIGNSMPHTVQVIAPAFENYRSGELAELTPGERWRLYVVPFDDAPEERQTWQQADDLDLFELPGFYAVAGVEVEAFSYSDVSLPFMDSAEYVSLFAAPINPPISVQAGVKRALSITRDLFEINKRLAKFEQRKGAVAEQFNTWLTSRDESLERTRYGNRDYYWLADRGSYFALPADYTNIFSNEAIHPTTLASLKALNRALEFHGVQFIVQVVPNIFDIGVRAMNPAWAELMDERSAMAVKNLLENNIEAIYTADDIIRRRHEFELLYMYPPDRHPHNGVQQILTDNIMPRLRRFGFAPVDNPAESGFKVENVITFLGKDYVWPTGVNIGEHTPGEVMTCDIFTYNNEHGAIDPESGILVIGNSIISSPGLDGAYANILGFKLNQPIDKLNVNGSSFLATIPQLIVNNPARYLKNKQVVILPVEIHNLYQPFAGDIYLMDMAKQLLSGKTPAAEYTPETDIERDPLITEFLLKPHPNQAGIRRAWEHLVFSSDCTEFFVPKSGTVQCGNYPIPEEYRATAVTAVVLVSPIADHVLSVEVNGKSQEVPLCSVNYQVWQRCVFEVAPGTESISVKLLGGKSDAIAAIKSITLYK